MNCTPKELFSMFPTWMVPYVFSNYNSHDKPIWKRMRHNSAQSSPGGKRLSSCYTDPGLFLLHSENNRQVHGSCGWMGMGWLYNYCFIREYSFAISTCTVLIALQILGVGIYVLHLYRKLLPICFFYFFFFLRNKKLTAQWSDTGLARTFGISPFRQSRNSTRFDLFSAVWFQSNQISISKPKQLSTRPKSPSQRFPYASSSFGFSNHAHSAISRTRLLVSTALLVSPGLWLMLYAVGRLT